MLLHLDVNTEIEVDFDSGMKQNNTQTDWLFLSAFKVIHLMFDVNSDELYLLRT